MRTNTFLKFLANGKMPVETDALDEAIERYQKETCDASLEDHDRKYHPNGFDPKKDSCKFRESMAKGDKADSVGSGEGDNGELGISDDEILNKKSVRITGLGDRDLVEVEGGYFHVLDPKDPHKSVGWGNSPEIAMMDAFENDLEYEGPYMMEALKALPWEQKDEVAKMFRKADELAQAETDFSLKHSKLDKYNRDTWDSPENEAESKRLSSEYDKANKEANDTFAKYATANGWKLGENDDGNTAWVKSDEKSNQASGTAEAEPGKNMPSMMHGSSTAAASALNNFVSRQNGPQSSADTPSAQRMAQIYAKRRDDFKAKMDATIKAGKKVKKADRDHYEVLVRSASHYEKLAKGGK